MAFNRIGFTTAAKAMGYSDEEINQIATVKETQSNSPINQSQDINLQSDKLKLQQEQIKTQGLINDPYGIKATEATAQSKAKMDALANLKEKSTFNAQNVQNAKDILDLINSGNLDKTQLNLLASKQAAHVGFGIGGKVLSEGEKAILQPMMANLAKSKTTEKGNILQRAGGWLSGAPVPQIERTQELLQDTPEQLKAKMLATIKTYGLDSDKVKYLQDQNKQISNTQPQVKQGWNGFTGNPVENLANDVVGGLKMAGQYLTTKHPEQGGLLGGLDITKTFPAAAKQLPEIGKSLGRTVGFGVKPDGTISWNPVDIARHAWNQPLETLAWLVALKGEPQGLGKKPPTELSSGGLGARPSGLIGKTASTGKNIIESTLETTTGGGTKELIAQNVLKDQAESLNKTLLDHDIYKYSDKGRIEATQKALVDEGANLAKKFAASKGTLNTSILDQQVDTILKSNGVSDPAVASQIKITLSDSGVLDLSSNTSTLTNYQLWEMAKKADEFGPKAFNIPSIGPQAKAITKDISRYLRGYLAENVKEATPNMRAYANLRTYMDDILTDPAGIKVKGAMSIMNVIANVANAAVGKPLEVAGQKAYNLLDTLSPELKTSAPSVSLNKLPVIKNVPQGFTRKPLGEMPQIMTSIEQNRPAQSSRLLRDMRYKQGHFVPRGIQEKILRSASKKKYK